MTDAERFDLALRAHAQEHAAMRTHGLALHVAGGRTLNALASCPDMARVRRTLQRRGTLNGVYGFGSLTPAQKTLASVGVVGGIAIGLGALLWWASSR